MCASCRCTFWRFALCSFLSHNVKCKCRVRHPYIRTYFDCSNPNDRKSNLLLDDHDNDEWAMMSAIATCPSPLLVDPPIDHSVMSTTSSTLSTSNTFKYEKEVCALSWWEPIRLLEEGSISDIHLVKRRDKFVKVRYKEKRNVMELAKRHTLPQFLFRRQPDKEEELCVLKSIHKDHIGDEAVLEEMRSEILVMSQLHHPNIVKLKEAYERRRHIYLVMEYMPGGNLCHHVYPEEEAKPMIHKILSAVAYLHAHGVAHRDIKLENIMLDAKGQVKLIDFGLATKYLSEDFSNMTDTVGTLYSMAPEVIQGVHYDSKCDLWSVGVVAYMLLSGVRPFWGPLKPMVWSKRRLVMMGLIQKGEYAPMTDQNFWDGVSDQAKDFVRSLLRVDPKERPTATEALASPWFNSTSGLVDGDGNDVAASKDASIGLTENDRDDFKEHLHGTEFRAYALQLLTRKLTSAEVEQLEIRLQEADEAGNGILEVPTFVELLQDLPSLTQQDVEQLTQHFEESHKPQPKIEYIDFMIQVILGRQRLIMDSLAATLDSLDTMGSREIVVNDLIPLLDKPEHRLSEEMQQEIRQKVLSIQDKQGMASTVAILEWFGKLVKQSQRHSVRSLPDESETSIR